MGLWKPQGTPESVRSEGWSEAWREKHLLSAKVLGGRVWQQILQQNQSQETLQLLPTQLGGWQLSAYHASAWLDHDAAVVLLGGGGGCVDRGGQDLPHALAHLPFPAGYRTGDSESHSSR